MPLLPLGHPALTPLSARHFTVRPKLYVMSVGYNSADSTGGPLEVGDQLKNFQIRQDLDNAMGTFTLTFARGRGTQSLSPFMFGGSRSYIGTQPTFQAHHFITLQPYIDGIEMPPIFEGRIDNADYAPGGDTIVVTGRDAGAYVAGATLFAKMYGSDGGTELYDVLAEMLSDCMSVDPSSVLPPVSTGFMVLPYAQDLSQGLEAMRVAAQQIGWDVRYVPSGVFAGGLGNLTLKLYDPGRDRTFPDVVIRKDRYNKISELKVGDEDVRNWWRLWWKDLNGVVHGPIETEDAASISQYGRRYAQVYLDRADLIRSDAAALNFLGAALADNKDPFASHRVDMPFYPDVLLNDMHLYEANGKDYDVDQLRAVVGYQHSWSSDPNTMPKTTIATRGQPIAAYREYRLSKTPAVLVSLDEPNDADGAPENTIAFQVTDLTP